MKSWREEAAPIVRRAILDGQAQGLSGSELRRFVSERYPFGERAMHPYKIWLSEVARQLGPSPTARAFAQAKIDAWNKSVGQGQLFGEEKPT